MTGERTQNLIPFVHIAEVARSIASTSYWIRAQGPHERAGRLDWAALESDDTQLTLAHRARQSNADKQALLFYLYSGISQPHATTSRRTASRSARSATAAPARRARWASATPTAGA